MVVMDGVVMVVDDDVTPLLSGLATSNEAVAMLAHSLMFTLLVWDVPLEKVTDVTAAEFSLYHTSSRVLDWPVTEPRVAIDHVWPAESVTSVNCPVP